MCAQWEGIEVRWGRMRELDSQDHRLRAEFQLQVEAGHQLGPLCLHMPGSTCLYLILTATLQGKCCYYLVSRRENSGNLLKVTKPVGGGARSQTGCVGSTECVPNSPLCCFKAGSGRGVVGGGALPETLPLLGMGTAVVPLVPSGSNFLPLLKGPALGLFH